MNETFTHNLGQEKARAAASAALESYKKQYPQYQPDYRWINNNRAEFSFNVKMKELSGYLDINDTTIDIDLDVPFYLRMFKKQAMSVITGQIAYWVNEARSGKV